MRPPRPRRHDRFPRLAPPARARGALLLAALTLATAGAGCRRDETAPPVLAAAASLRSVLPALLAAFGSRHPGPSLVATYGGSGELQRQVLTGAPVEGVLFASAAPVDRLVARGALDAATRAVVATNTLVVAVRAGAPPRTFESLGALPAGERVALGEPGAVPAGDYARAHLAALGRWDEVRRRAVFASDVTAVLTYVRRGEVAAGIVYETELRGQRDVVVAARAQGPAAPRPEVVVAARRGAAPDGRTRRFLSWLTSAEARALFAAHGFGAP